MYHNFTAKWLFCQELRRVFLGSIRSLGELWGENKTTADIQFLRTPAVVLICRLLQAGMGTVVHDVYHGDDSSSAIYRVAKAALAASMASWISASW